MPNETFPKTPIFIPKVMESTIVDLGITFPAVLMDSHHIEWRKKVQEKVIEVCTTFIVDPVTYHLLYPDARLRKNFKKLPYVDGLTPETLYSSPTERLDKLIKPCIEDEKAKGASVYIAPSLFAEDTDDTKFVTNLSLLSETIRYVRSQNDDTPIFASINIGSSVLNRPVVINYIVDMYTEEFDGNVAGYFLCINDFDARKANFQQLIGLANLVFKLSCFKDVFVKQIGGFGEVLCAIGASGYVSGLGEGETFSVKNLEKRVKGFGRDGGWTYVPEIFDHANDVELKKIGYTCPCQYCHGAFATTPSDKKLHILTRKLEVVDALSGMDRDAKIDYMTSKVDDAIKAVAGYTRNFASPFKLSHLQNWVAVLKEAKGWECSAQQSPEELNQLLSELENNNDTSSS